MRTSAKYPRQRIKCDACICLVVTVRRRTSALTPGAIYGNAKTSVTPAGLLYRHTYRFVRLRRYCATQVTPVPSGRQGNARGRARWSYVCTTPWPAVREFRGDSRQFPATPGGRLPFPWGWLPTTGCYLYSYGD